MLRQGCSTIGAVIFCLILNACSGGGASSNIQTSAKQTAAGSDTKIQFSIAVTKPQNGARQVKYISSSTKSVTIAVATSGVPFGNVTTVNCATSCTATMSAPLGIDTFTVNLYDQNNGQGNVLSSGTTTTNIVAGLSNSVSVGFGGAVARIAVSASNTVFVQGTAAQVPLMVTAYDADGNAIVGSQPFLTPITLKNTDVSGVTTLSNTTLTQPSSSAILAYSGGNLSTAVISASVNDASGIASTPLNFTASAPIQPAGPVSGIQSHMMIYAVLPGNFHNQQGVDSSAQAQSNYQTIAKYVDYIETDNRASGYAHNAGMKTGFYTDPLQAHGGELNWPDAAFAHDCSGNLVIPNYPEPERLGDINSPAFVQAWNAEIQTHLHDQWGSYPQDFVRSDDSGYPGQQWQGYFAGSSNGPREPAGMPYCNYSDSSFLTGLHSAYALASVPVLFNGATDPSYLSYASGQSNVMGGQCETCFGGWTGSTWRAHVNTEIAFVNQGKIFNSFSHGNASHDQQLYLYASMLLGYDPKHTLLSMDIPTPSGISTTPLAMLIPLAPTVTGTTVDSYLTPEGVYARQFGACYISQVATGPCAVVVNADTAAHSYPSSLAMYHHTITFSGDGIAQEYGDTGNVSPAGAAPSSQISAMSATIVFN